MENKTTYKLRTSLSIERASKTLRETLTQCVRHEIEVRKGLLERAKTQTLREIADEYEGITYGDIYRVVKCNKFPASNKKREALGVWPMVRVPDVLANQESAKKKVERYQKIKLSDNTLCTSWDGKQMTLRELRKYIRENPPPAYYNIHR